MQHSSHRIGLLLAFGLLSGCITFNPLQPNVRPCLDTFRNGGAAPRSPAAAGEAPSVLLQTGHSGAVSRIELTPDGKYAVVGETQPARVKLWELETGREVLTYPTRSEMLGGTHISGDGRRLMLDSSTLGGVEVFDLLSGASLATCKEQFGGLSPRIPFGAISPDGRYGSARGYSSDPYDAKVEVWDLAAGDRIATLKVVLGVAEKFSPEGDALLVPSGNSELQLVDVKTQKTLKTWKVIGQLTTLAFSQDGRTVFATNKESALWAFDRSTGAVRLDGVPIPARGYIQSLSSLKDGRQLLIGEFQGDLGIYDLEARRWKAQFASAGRPASALSPDGTKLFVATPGKFFLWRLADGRPEAVWSPESGERAETAVFLPGGKQVALVRRAVNKQHVELFDLEKKRSLWRTPAEDVSATLSELSVTPEGRYLVASMTRLVQGQMQPTTLVIDVASGRVLNTIALFPPSYLTLQTAAVALSGGRLALATRESARSSTSVLHIIDAATGKTLVQHTCERAVLGLGVSADGRRPLIIEVEMTKEPNSQVQYVVSSFDPEQRTFRRETETTAFQSLQKVMEGPNRQYVLGGIEKSAGLSSGEMLKWMPLTMFHPGTGAPQSLAKQNLRWAGFSKDGARMLWVGDDGFVHVRDSGSGAELLRLASFDDGEWVLMTPEGFFSASNRGAQYLTVRSGNTSYAIDQFYERLYRPDVVLATLAGKKEDAPAENLTAMLQQGPPPTVRILSPTSGEQSKRDIEVEVELTDAGGGIGRIEWRVNGAVVGVAGERGLKAKTHTANKEQRREKRLLTLGPGDNRIEVVVSNAEGGASSAPVGVDLFLKDEISEPPSLHILAIAINQYRDRSLKLSYAVPDAKSLAESFQRGAKSVFTNVETTLVLDADATADKIAATFATLASKVKSNDVFVLFIAGHGITQEGRYHYLPSDFRYTNEESIKAKAINQDHIQQWMSAIAAKKSLVLLDTCNSGSFVQAQAVSRGIQEKMAIDKLTRATGRATIAASTDSQVALEGHEGHGVFTWVVLDAFLKADKEFGNRDGVLTTSELAAFVNEYVPGITYKRWGYEQVPQVNLNGREFPIAVSEGK
jgi:WD40 repeat protein